jgi:hypothetical protein
MYIVRIIQMIKSGFKNVDIKFSVDDTFLE